MITFRVGTFYVFRLATNILCESRGVLGLIANMASTLLVTTYPLGKTTSKENTFNQS
jgi:hypothetical protein